MAIHPVFALIDGGAVANMIVCDGGYTVANDIAHAAFGPEAFAVDASQYAAAIGDLYRDGSFWRKGADGQELKISRIPTAEEEMPAVREDLGGLEEYALGLDCQLAMLQLGI